MTVVDDHDDPGDKSAASETAVKPCQGQRPGQGDGPAAPGGRDSIRADEKEKAVASDTSEDGNDARSNNTEHDVELGHQARSLPSGASHEPDGPPLSRIASSFANTTTTRIVPRADRRGLLGRFAVIPEIENPYQYKNTTKWMITAVVSLAAAGAPLGTSIFLRES
jgi:hypothetical protein